MDGSMGLLLVDWLKTTSELAGQGEIAWMY
jgi:hypothetical protein